MQIKLKMGKEENESAEQPDSETTEKKDSSEDKVKEQVDKVEEKTKEDEDKKEPSKEEPDEKNKKEDADKLRRVIKVDDKKGKKEEKEPVEEDADGGTSSREGLEQKRAILQSIKDFDFQIKKNQEEITGLNKKLDSVSKDLDDLVSLYEIVSEQMNPFVGLSKVTKKRLDALESFTREIELLKERTNELESFAERSGAKLKRISEGDLEPDTIDTDAILDKEESGEEIDNVTGEDKNTDEVKITTEVQSEPISDSTMWENLSDEELDVIIERAFGNVPLNGRIDTIIDNFIENLKG